MGTESSITVRATPQITWISPASIVYGTPLGAAQLDASASVPGTFTYMPAEGAVLNAGSGQVLSVTFTPQDSTYYTAAAATTNITVAKAAPILEVTAAGGRFDGGPFPAVATIAGAIAGVDNAPASGLENVVPILNYFDGSGTAGMSLGSAPPSAAGTYTVVADFSGSADYLDVVSAPITFTIGQPEKDRFVVRGGAWWSVSRMCASHERQMNHNNPNGFRGFRIVLGPAINQPAE